MKHFLGSCQQNRHLRQRQTERETGRERGREREREGEREGTTLRSWNVETGSPGGTSAGVPASPATLWEPGFGARELPVRGKGRRAWAAVGAGAEALTRPGAGAQFLRARPHSSWGTRGLHTALCSLEHSLRAWAAVRTAQSRTYVPVAHAVKAVWAWHILKAPATHKTTSHVSITESTLCNFWTDS